MAHNIVMKKYKGEFLKKLLNPTSSRSYGERRELQQIDNILLRPVKLNLVLLLQPWGCKHTKIKTSSGSLTSPLFPLKTDR